MWEQKVRVSADWNADFQLNLSQSSSEKSKFCIKWGSKDTNKINRTRISNHFLPTRPPKLMIELGFLVSTVALILDIQPYKL